MHFDQLPADSRLRIYTLSGEKVKELNATSSGLATWDGTNSSGQKVASGVYLVLVEGAGDKRKMKVAVQR
jgi:flagellar hook assembly protein FlgD